MKSDLFKVLPIMLAAVLLLTFSFTACNNINTGQNDQNGQNDQQEQGVAGIADLIKEPAVINMCLMEYSETLQPRNSDAINEMLKELNTKLAQDLNMQLKIQWLPYKVSSDNTTYDSKIEEMLKAGNAPDIFTAPSYLKLMELSGAGYIMDITDMLPKYALRYYLQLMKTNSELINYLKFDNKLYGVLNNALISPRNCVVARTDLVSRYAPGGIHTYDDYDRFLKDVKANEKEIIPGYVSSGDFFDSYMQGSGYFMLFASTFYCRLDAADFRLVPMERIDEFKTAYFLYENWKKNGMLADPGNTDISQAIQDGTLASVVFQMSYDYYRSIAVDKFNYSVYPLYLNRQYVRSGLPYSIAVNSRSKYPERALMFIDWLESSQENYDLFMYGIKDKNYKLNGNALDMSGIDWNSQMFRWEGSDAFKNYNLDRPFPYEPEDYKAYIEKCALNNTITNTQLFNNHGIDLVGYLSRSNEKELDDNSSEHDQILALLDKRTKLYQSFTQRVDTGEIEGALQEFIGQINDADSDKIVNYYLHQIQKVKDSQKQQ